MGDEQAVGIATAALFKLGTEPGTLQSPSWYRSLHHFSRRSPFLLLELKLLLSTLHPSSPGCPASAASPLPSAGAQHLRFGHQWLLLASIELPADGPAGDVIPLSACP